ncbi:MAG: class IV adenylate cyclase [Gemmatimonadaceae bacterium]
MLEVELKSVVDDEARRRAAVERAGATLVFTGRLEDRRYDTPDRALSARDEVLRLRTYRTPSEKRAELDWKGPTRREDGYKMREELDVHVGDPDALARLLERLDYRVTMAIDRTIVQYDLGGAMVRFERYPRMDDLVEVEGTADQIEHAIAVLGLPREGFTSERLTDFVRRYEARSGVPAALSDAELRGDVHYDAANA